LETAPTRVGRPPPSARRLLQSSADLRPAVQQRAGASSRPVSILSGIEDAAWPRAPRSAGAPRTQIRKYLFTCHLRKFIANRHEYQSWAKLCHAHYYISSWRREFSLSEAQIFFGAPYGHTTTASKRAADPAPPRGPSGTAPPPVELQTAPTRGERPPSAPRVQRAPQSARPAARAGASSRSVSILSGIEGAVAPRPRR